MVGEFVGRNDHHYKVEFLGDGVRSNDMKLSSVVISVEAGDRKFSGFKSTTCTVTILTDTPLVDLYASGVRDISATVTDVTDGEVIFFGYVVPFAFEQPFTGCLDSVTINCVDAITATKDYPYLSVNDESNYGVDETAESIIGQAISASGLKKYPYEIICHDNFGDGSAEDSVISAVKVAQAGFLQDGLTALDALNAVCLFFGYTAILRGYKLYLYDEHCLTHAEDAYARNTHVAKFTTNESGKKVWSRFKGDQYRKVTLDNTRLRNGISLSVERAYDGIQLKLSGSSTSVLLPDVCSADNIERNTDGRGTENVLKMGNIDGKEYWEYRMPVASKVMEMGLYDDKTKGLVDWDNPNQLEFGGWRNGAMMIVCQHFDIGRLDGQYVGGQKYEYVYPKGGGEKVLLWLRAYDSYRSAAEQTFKRYSHTGGWLELRYKFSVVSDDVQHYTNPLDRTGEGTIRFISIKVGDKYFWKDYDNHNPFEFSDENKCFLKEVDGNSIPTQSAAAFHQDKILIPVPSTESGKQVSIGLSWWSDSFDVINDGERTISPENGIFIEQLELVGSGDDVWEGHWDMKHDFKVNPENILNVDVALSTRQSKQADNPDKHLGYIGVNARPGVVVGSFFPFGGYCGLAQIDAMPLCGIIIEQLKARYGEPHERFNVTTEGVDILPTDTIVFNGSDYTIEGYDIDLVDSTTTIIIN